MSVLAPPTVLRAGKIDFLNTLPFFHDLKEESTGVEVQWVKGAPSELNEKMGRGELDMGLTSSFVYALEPEKYLILPDLCIGANGKAGSVSLYSIFPIQLLNGKKIAITRKSLSAATLLKVLMKLCWNFKNEFEVTDLPAEKALKLYPACLSIGDEALFYQPADKYVCDLSEHWLEWTGKPFCFALWTVRKEYFQQAPGAVRSFYQSLEKNLTTNLSRLSDLVEKSGVKKAEKEIVFRYLRSLEYRLNPEVQEGLKLFFSYARQTGLLEREPALNFCF